MRPTSSDHFVAISEALNSISVKEQIALKEIVPHMYLLNMRCDCISVTPKQFRFRVTLDYSVIRNREIPSHEEVVVMVDIQRKGDTREVAVISA